MSEEHPHPLLQQLPLTVSPYLSLPTATPLPYTYKSVPSTLPHSVIDNRMHQQDGQPTKPEYVISAAGGHSAHPDSIIESCRALQAHLERMQAESRATIAKWDQGIRDRELKERKRVAPGWLDVEEGNRILVPQKSTGVNEVSSEMQNLTLESDLEQGQKIGDDEGDALDRAFGRMGVQ